MGRDEILDLLTGLVDKSLVLVEEAVEETERRGAEPPRYRLLETIRQYSRERLFESGEATGMRQRHFDWFLALAERAEPELDGPRQRQWLDHLEREHENLRAALHWAEESRQAESGLQLGRKLWQFWWVRGYLAEGRDRLAALLARAEPSARTAARAKALHGAGILAQDQGDYRAARTLHEESLAIKRELGDQAGVAASLNNLGHVARLQGDYRAARALYEEGLGVGREMGDPRGLAFSLRGLGLIARYQGDFPSACACYDESLTIARRLGDERAVAISLNNLALVALDGGDPEGARQFYQESLTIKQELGDRRGIAFALNGLGLTALYRGDDEPARHYFDESLSIRRELGDRRGTAFSLHGLGTLALRMGDYAGARALYEESLAIRRELGDRRGIARSLLDLARSPEKKWNSHGRSSCAWKASFSSATWATGRGLQRRWRSARPSITSPPKATRPRRYASSVVLPPSAPPPAVPTRRPWSPNTRGSSPSCAPPSAKRLSPWRGMRAGPRRRGSSFCLPRDA